MSARVRAASQRPARAGDGRRLRWSESPIPRVVVRRVRAVGAPVSCCVFYPPFDAYGAGNKGVALTCPHISAGNFTVTVTLSDPPADPNQPRIYVDGVSDVAYNTGTEWLGGFVAQADDTADIWVTYDSVVLNMTMIRVCPMPI